MTAEAVLILTLIGVARMALPPEHPLQLGVAMSTVYVVPLLALSATLWLSRSG
ncbi:hypothetical protein [Haloferax marisrubri]|uniref:hypothetical protein n=1 Tax=Haloferax marisrubri TaxID=1544719 RepID=UPI000B1B6155|nr:hypothetical protein [Haloferax marisrubri]